MIKRVRPRLNKIALLHLNVRMVVLLIINMMEVKKEKNYMYVEVEFLDQGLVIQNNPFLISTGPLTLMDTEMIAFNHLLLSQVGIFLLVWQPIDDRAGGTVSMVQLCEGSLAMMLQDRGWQVLIDGDIPASLKSHSHSRLGRESTKEVV